jgi:RNA polymerase sigma-70 factor (ECF subfamily)
VTDDSLPGRSLRYSRLPRHHPARPDTSDRESAASVLPVHRSARSRTEDALTAHVRQMQHGDEQAFIEVYRAVHPPLLRYLGVLVGATDGEDVASETWGQVCRDLHTFRGDADGFRGWVTTIGRHRALDHLRARGRRPIVDISIDDLHTHPQVIDAETAALEALSTTAAVRLIATLPLDQGEAILLRAVMGLDAKAAGAALGKRAGAVRMAAYRGLRTLAAQLEPPARASDISATTDAEEVR